MQLAEANTPPGLEIRRAHSARCSWACGLLALVVSLALSGCRDWIILAHRQLAGLGAYGDYNVLRGNKLSGWFHLGTVVGHWHRSWFWSGVFWEWLPAVFFALGLFLVLRQFPAPLRIRLPRGATSAPVVSAGVLAGACVLTWVCFEGIPHVQDSIAQQFQAEIFARGALFAPVPAGVDFFPHEFIVHQDGRWYAQYPPMQAALLALGTLAGVPWLVNPVLGALSALFLYGAARRTYGPRLARVSLLFFAASPFVWFMSAERMNHVGTLFFVSMALYALAPALGERNTRLHPARWLWAALALGLAVSTRPLCAVAAAAPLLAGALWPRPGVRRGAEPAPAERAASPVMFILPLLACGLLLGAAPLLLFNWATTGSPLVSGYEIQWGSSGMGFGQSQWGPPHTPELGVQHLLANWDGAGKYLYEWPIPCLLPLLGLFFLPRRTRMDWVLLGILGSVTLAYVPYFFQDLCLGPRFLYAAMPAFVMLSARGLVAGGAAWGRWLARRPLQGARLAGQVAVFCAAAGLLVNAPVLLQWYGTDFWGTGRASVNAARAMRLGPAVVFIRDYGHARWLDLQELGVSRRVAQGAMENLDDEWLDEMTERARGMARSTRGEWLESALAEAIDSPNRPHRRTRPPWMDWQGVNASIYRGLWADTPWPERQDIIFAVDRGARNGELLQAYPGRTPWRLDFDAQTSDFCLMPFHREPEAGVRLTHNGGGLARKPKTP